MNVSTDYPPNIEKIRAHFGEHSDVVYTYGDTIYNPDNGTIHEHLHAHEAIHSMQQGNDPEAWWERYLADPDFRVMQEAEAYRAQYRWARAHVGDRNAVARFLHRLATDFSSGIYGSCVSFADAKGMITA